MQTDDFASSASDYYFQGDAETDAPELDPPARRNQLEQERAAIAASLAATQQLAGLGAETPRDAGGSAKGNTDPLSPASSASPSTPRSLAPSQPSASWTDTPLAPEALARKPWGASAATRIDGAAVGPALPRSGSEPSPHQAPVQIAPAAETTPPAQSVRQSAAQAQSTAEIASPAKSAAAVLPSQGAALASTPAPQQMADLASQHARLAARHALDFASTHPIGRKVTQLPVAQALLSALGLGAGEGASATERAPAEEVGEGAGAGARPIAESEEPAWRRLARNKFAWMGAAGVVVAFWMFGGDSGVPSAPAHRAAAPTAATTSASSAPTPNGATFAGAPVKLTAGMSLPGAAPMVAPVAPAAPSPQTQPTAQASAQPGATGAQPGMTAPPFMSAMTLPGSAAQSAASLVEPGPVAASPAAPATPAAPAAPAVPAAPAKRAAAASGSAASRAEETPPPGAADAKPTAVEPPVAQGPAAVKPAVAVAKAPSSPPAAKSSSAPTRKSVPRAKPTETQADKDAARALNRMLDQELAKQPQ